MSRKLKFRPRITRVKLNPEQAVLGCNCFQGTTIKSFAGGGAYGGYMVEEAYTCFMDYKYKASQCIF